jgi:hypothetical protein
MSFHYITRPVPPLVAIVVLLAACTTSASAQTLGDVARREAERRQQVASGRVYTNDDLGPVESASSPAPQAPVETPASSGESSTTPPGTSKTPAENNPGEGSVTARGREKRDEQYWRTLIGGLRARVDRAKVEVTAQEARLMELDGGPQTAAVLRDREIVAATLNRAQRDLKSLSDELSRSLTRAQNNKVPDEWIK